MLRTLLITITLLLNSCGSGDGNDGTVLYEGILTTVSGVPVEGAVVTLFETSETATTDDQGSFSFESFKVLSSASFFFLADGYTNTVRVDTIPADTAVVRISFVQDSDTVRIQSVEFGSEPGELPETPTPNETPDPTGTARPTPTAKPGNFDADGNTTRFGIPSGLIGNIDRGRSSWSGTCTSCHAREKSNRTYQDIGRALRTQAEMQDLRVSDRTVADITAYLNRGRK